jgi:hypothetical protein
LPGFYEAHGWIDIFLPDKRWPPYPALEMFSFCSKITP